MKPYNTKLIINNLDLVLRTQDIEKLNRATYNFLHFTSGLINHYNFNGFKCNYKNSKDLINDILNSQDIVNPECYIKGFFTGRDAIYYRSKYETLIAIKKILEKHNSIV